MADAGGDEVVPSAAGSSAADPALLLQHLGTAAEVSSEAMLCVSADGLVFDFNPAAVRLLSPAVRLSPGTSLADAFTDRATFADLVRRSLVGERLRNELLQVDGPDGRGGPVLASLAASGTGTDRCVTVVLRDISEEVTAQEVLAEAERRVQQAEALARTGTFVKDSRDRAMQWSTGMYVVHGLEPGAVIPSRESHLKLVHPEDRTTVGGALDEALAGADQVTCDYRLDVESGDPPRWIRMAVGAKRAPSGVVVGVSGVCQDVTEQVTAEGKLREALALEQAAGENLRRLADVKDEFLATVSHELRNPITTILGYSGVLRAQAPEHDRMLEPIERNAQSMNRLIEILLDEARLARGKVSLVVRRIPVEPAARAVIEERLAGVADQPWTLAVDAGLTIDMDRDAFSLVLGNLMSNAVKYGAGRPIEVTAEPRPGSVAVSVSDHGPGIPEEHMEHLFDAFYRIPGSGEIARGSGLGLSIVRRYVELHGGSVSCVSAPDAGSTFTFEVPTRSGDPEAWSDGEA